MKCLSALAHMVMVGYDCVLGSKCQARIALVNEVCDTKLHICELKVLIKHIFVFLEVFM